MSCERCGGFMVIESPYDRMEAKPHMEIGTKRCVNCGNFEDPVIRTNRAISKQYGSVASLR